MTDNLAMHDLLTAILKQLRRLNESARMTLEATCGGGAGYTRPLAAYLNFDWAEIGAEAVTKDEWGATVVLWGGQEWKRRAPDNNYGVDIWFSRCTGREILTPEGGGKPVEKNLYAHLIKFQERETDRKVSRLGQDARDALTRYRAAANQLPENRKAVPAPPPPLAPPVKAAPSGSPPPAEPSPKPPEPVEPPSAVRPLTDWEIVIPDGDALKRAALLTAQSAVFFDPTLAQYVVTDGGREFTVWRSERGAIICGCPRLPLLRALKPDARCEHILAVKTFAEVKAEEKKAA